MRQAVQRGHREHTCALDTAVIAAAKVATTAARRRVVREGPKSCTGLRPLLSFYGALGMRADMCGLYPLQCSTLHGSRGYVLARSMLHTLKAS